MSGSYNTVTIAGQVSGRTAIRMDQSSVSGFGGGTVTVGAGGVVSGGASAASR